MTWWGWALVGWLVLAIVVSVPLGLAMREADRRERAHLAGVPLPGRAPRRRRIPVPPVGIGLAVVAVALEAVGFVLRTAGADRTGTGRLFAMDAPLSVPRMFVTALFLVAALAAFAGATRTATRRAWWAGVGLVAVLVAEVKGGGTVHARALEVLGVADAPALALGGSAVVLAAVVAGLWWLSRTERRDRRRVLLAFAGYGVAATGLSALSTVVAQATGRSSFWAASAVFAEEGAEALGAAAVLLTVLVGVAPRLVLPADWTLRRSADAETVNAPDVVRGWSLDRRSPRR